LSSAIHDKEFLFFARIDGILGDQGGIMKNFAAALIEQQQGDEDCLVNRIAYAGGVSILLLGTVLPHSRQWTMLGIALIAFSYLF
jgi:hypothetical protein